uniref:ethanolamine kinase n=2 Tax=Schistosoma mansoni TaxID=6183 RepID=A0A5K4FCL7_SCHMA
MNEQNIPYFNLTINGINDYVNIQKLILLLFPKYEIKNIVAKVLNKGYSNQLIRIDNDPHSSLLIRIYGDLTTSLINRTNEMKYIQIVGKLKGYQRIYGIFNNGFVYSYIDGNDITLEKLSDIKYGRLIAKKMAQLHCLPIDEFIQKTQNDTLIEKSKPESQLFPTIFKWIDRLDEEFIDSSRNIKKYESIFPSKSYVLNEVIQLKDQYLFNPISKVVLCHNDLNAANIILAPDGNSVHLIDMEYCDLNYAAYDIGNHFCEFTGPYATEFQHYPSIEYQKEWINAYLTAYYKYSQSKLDLQLNIYKEDYINQWLKEVNCFALVSHLLWAVWAVICASENLRSMDFLAYADSRMKQYYNMKKWLPSTFQLPIL